MRSWRSLFRLSHWKRIAQEAEDADMLERVGRCLRTARPLASDRFIARTEAMIGVRLRPARVGRSRRKTTTKRGC